ncbi:hypothetical protein [Sphingomonas abietis]|uniref:Uncharacterized protein n=1 Tax=Sphingomonas abietis TaxID=3012344 RepID=A0ABY7NHP4_9SPHN|nr:hypothetical protein [Sphingomonas abietis]WBO21038.1 hypothetical protein PBT88_12570 [Sphingomonas abietis]
MFDDQRHENAMQRLRDALDAALDRLDYREAWLLAMRIDEEELILI